MCDFCTDDIDTNLSVLLETIDQHDVYELHRSQHDVPVRDAVVLPASDSWKVFAHHHRLVSNTVRDLCNDCNFFLSNRMEHRAHHIRVHRHVCISPRRMLVRIFFLLISYGNRLGHALWIVEPKGRKV